MNSEFHPDAEREFYDAANRYEAERDGLGVEFINEVESTIRSIVDNPLQFPLHEDSLRIAKTRRFPYGLIYWAGDDLKIVAVMHLHRRPGYWKGRLRDLG